MDKTHTKQEKVMAEQEINNLKKEIENLKQDIGSLTVAIKELARAKTDETKKKIEDEIDLQGLKEKLEELKAKGREGLDSVEDEIRTHPFQTAAITFGLGALVAFFLSSKR